MSKALKGSNFYKEKTMILKTIEDFQSAILAEQEIKTQTVFYVGELEKEKTQLPVGSLCKGGILAGYLDDNPVVAALKDLDKQYTWEEAKSKCAEAYRLPTQQELMLIYINKEIINKALIENGGEPLKDDWYWSSSEYNFNSAWYIRFSDGSVYNYYNKTSYGYVRPVLAF